MSKRTLASRLLDWHGGGGTGLYSVGSTLFAAKEPDPEQVARAINELRTLKAYARFPECVTAEDEAECNALADELESRFSCGVMA
jgi:ribosomal protein L10